MSSEYGTGSDDEAYRRLTAFGNQLVEVHYWLRDQLDELRDGVEDYFGGKGLPATDLRAHCLAFCSALSRHHTGEDRGAFPLIAEEHPELRAVIAGLRSDHHHIEWILGNLRKLLDRLPAEPDPESAGSVRQELDALSALMQTHFVYEEKKLLSVLNDMDVPQWRAEPPEFLRHGDDVEP